MSREREQDSLAFLHHPRVAEEAHTYNWIRLRVASVEGLSPYNVSDGGGTFLWCMSLYPLQV